MAWGRIYSKPCRSPWTGNSCVVSCCPSCAVGYELAGPGRATRHLLDLTPVEPEGFVVSGKVPDDQSDAGVPPQRGTSSTDKGLAPGKPNPNRSGECLQIIESRAQHTRNDGEVDIQVFVHQHVSEARYAPQSLGEGGLQDSDASQGVDSRGVVGDVLAGRRGDMGGDVQRTLDGDLQAMEDRPLEVDVALQLLSRHTAVPAQVGRGPLDVREPAQNHRRVGLPGAHEARANSRASMRSCTGFQSHQRLMARASRVVVVTRSRLSTRSPSRST